jgi:hypothetical protein
VFFVILAAMCRAMVLRAPLASVEEVAEVDAMETAEVEEAPLVRVLAHVEFGLRAMMAHAFTVGVWGEELVDAACALISPVGDSEATRRRAVQMRAAAARGLAQLLLAAGHESAEIEEWGEVVEDRRVRPRLA